jgi:hypothetical protein
VIFGNSTSGIARPSALATEPVAEGRGLSALAIGPAVARPSALATGKGRQQGTGRLLGPVAGPQGGQCWEGGAGKG